MSVQAEPPAPIDVFFSYAPEDDEHRIELEKHLVGLERIGSIRSWSSRKVGAGEEWRDAADAKLGVAQLILLLVSADLLASAYCVDVEIPRSIERERVGEARVIPILVRPCDLGPVSFARLPSLPSDRRAVTSWPNRDEAWANVATGIREVVEELMEASCAPKTASGGRSMGDRSSNDEMRSIAQRLLEDATPASLIPLFANIPPAIVGAIQELARQPRRVRYDEAGTSTTCTIRDLTNRKRSKQMIVAPRGAGKSFALWQAASTMLADSSTIPIFLPLGRFGSWSDVLAHLKSFTSHSQDVLNDGRVVVFLDGWSEFVDGAGGDSPAHRFVLSAIGDRRIVASARYGSEHDARFDIAQLEPFSGDTVRKVLQFAYPDAAAPSNTLLELLQLPLALVLHFLLGGPAASRGELLASFQQRLSIGLPTALTTCLARAAARTSLISKSRRRVVFEAELRRAGAELGISEPVELVRRLGTFGTTAADVRPVHDLYWSWLVGVGLLEMRLIASAMTRLDLRESIDLGIESGTHVSPELIHETQALDAVLAMRLAAAAIGEGNTALNHQVQIMLQDSRSAVRRRGALAAFKSVDSLLFRGALNVMTDFQDQGIYPFALENDLSMDVLWQQRSELAAWIGGNGTTQVLEAIALRGDGRWSDWLERLVSSGRLAGDVAGPVAIACSQTVPAWTRPFLATIGGKAYRLRHAATRGANLELARWLADKYEQNLRSGVSFWNVNPILVKCGNDAVFEGLLQRFESLSDNAQEALGYAVVERGEPWLSNFQRHVFANGYRGQCHALSGQVSPLIDDETARCWLEHGPTLLGWQVLIKRHGNAIVPEILARLPDSFSDLHHIPELLALASLDNAPEEIVDELWKRVSGNISEALLEDLLGALARARLQGMPSVVARLRHDHFFFPPCSFSRFLVLFTQWEARTGFVVRVSDGTKDRHFSEWIRLARWEKERNEPLVGHRHSANNCRLPVSDDVLDAWAAGQESFAKFVHLSGPLDRYHAKTVDFLLTQPSGGKEILKLFGDVLAQFPEAVLLRILAQMTSGASDDYHSLLNAVATSNESGHREFHAALIRHFLSQSSLDIHASHKLAIVLRAHSANVLRVLLGEAIDTANGLWLVRDIELASGFLLADEDGHWSTP